MIHLTNFEDTTLCGIQLKDIDNRSITKNIFQVDCEHCIRIISRELQQETEFDIRKELGL